MRRGAKSPEPREPWAPIRIQVGDGETQMPAIPLNPAESRSQAELDALDDDALVRLARSRSEFAIRALTRRYNRRLFRLARSILRDEAEAEDVVQEAWVRAFTALDGFRAEAAFSTWLTRIALNEALGRL